MSYAYTQRQVEENLLKQGYSPEQANQMAMMLGDVKSQDSNIMPNLLESSAYAGGLYALKNKNAEYAAQQLAEKAAGKRGLMAGAKKIATGGFGVPLLAASAVSNLYPMLSGNNFYDKASASQLGADLAGQVAFGYAGEKIGTGIAKSLAARAAAGTAGRAIGGTLGSVAGPIGSVLGGVLGGYLIPKLFKNEDEKLLEPEKGVDGSTLAALAAAGAIASPLGRPVRALTKKGLSSANEFMGRPVSWAGPEVENSIKNFGREAGQIASNYKQAFLTDPLSRNTLTRNVSKAYNDAALHNRVGIQRNIDLNHIPDPDSFRGTLYNARMTLANTKAVAPALEQLGLEMGNLYKKRKNQ